MASAELSRVGKVVGYPAPTRASYAPSLRSASRAA